LMVKHRGEFSPKRCGVIFFRHTQGEVHGR
jgi:hypothetical protein